MREKSTKMERWQANTRHYDMVKRTASYLCKRYYCNGWSVRTCDARRATPNVEKMSYY